MNTTCISIHDIQEARILAIADPDAENRAIVERWCAKKGTGWHVHDKAGRGGTAPVFKIESPFGDRALKILDAEYSAEDLIAESRERIRLQVEEIGEHQCENLVQVFDGGEFEGRLFLVMNLVPGQELSKALHQVPRDKIRGIIDQIAKACLFLREKGFCHRDIKVENIYISDDFKKATLLDVSVVRKIYDPIGIGTDHGNKLPVVATSRYTPPEYLFRLLDPGEDLWHAVDVYQLGCLVHDLVMREQMYEEEYGRAADNRYRFAWIVATQTPLIAATDIDTALVLLGQRALDRNWKRRSELKVEDFLSDKLNLTKIGRNAIGIGPRRTSTTTTGPSNARKLLSEYAEHLRFEMRSYLKSQGILANHQAKPFGGDTCWQVLLDWTLPPNPDSFEKIRLIYELALVSTTDTPGIELKATLDASGAMGPKSSNLELPQVDIDDEILGRLYTLAIASLDELTGMIVEN